MSLFQKCQWWALCIVFLQLGIRYATTSWPVSNSSSIRLLGLFQDAENISIRRDISVHSRAMFQAAILLSQQYNLTIEEQFIEWQSVQTGGNIIEALSETCQAVSQSMIVGIVGPEISREAHLIANFGGTTDIPVVSYAATDPDLSNRNVYPTFYRTVPSDSAAALAILNFFVRFNWTSCILIYQNDAFGSGGEKIIDKVFLQNDFIVREKIVFDIVTQSIQGNLKNYLSNSTARIVVVWAESSYTSIILQNALDSDVVGPHFTWILSSNVSLDSFDIKYRSKLIGMFLVEPVTGTVVGASVNTTLLSAAYQIWQQYEPKTFPGPTKVNYYALFAFDATWLLIQSLKQLCSQTTNNSCLSFTGSSYCFHRRFIHSDLLYDLISNTEFLGVSGPVRFSANVTDRINGLYYTARNVQPSSDGLSFVPVLDYSDSDGWKMHAGSSVILWPGNSLNVSTGRAMLKDVTLRIGVIESILFTIVSPSVNESEKNQTHLTGYVPDLIQLLRNQIGFIPNIQLAPRNENYSRLIEAVENGVYDIVIGDVTITSKRREIVGFSNSILDNSLRIIMRKTPDVQIDLLSFLKPFSRNLWLLILASFVYAGILLCLIEREHNEALQDRSIFFQFAMSAWYSFGNIVGYGVDFNVQTAAGRLLTAGLYILSLILVASYTANLASDLTILKSRDIISGIDDLKNGKIPLNRIGIRVETASEDYFLREISHGSRNYYPLTSRQDLYDSLLAGTIDVAFMDTDVAQYVTNNVYCNLTLIGEGFDYGAFGVVMAKDWIYRQDLDVNILILRESGALENLREKWSGTRLCPDSSPTSTAIGIESMSGLFLVFGIITIFSLFLLAWTKLKQIKKFFSILTPCLKSSSRK